MIGWQTPYTNWSEGDYVTYEDMNRIGGNLNYLLNGSTAEDIKETWTQDDFVSKSDWDAITLAVRALCTWCDLAVDVFPTSALSAENFLIVESLTERLKQPVELRWAQEGKYLNDDAIVSDNSLIAYLGGGI